LLGLRTQVALLIYAIGSGGYLILSDAAIALLGGNGRLAPLAFSLRDVSFIAATTFLAFLFARNSESRVKSAKEALWSLENVSDQTLDGLPVNVMVTEVDGTARHINRFGLAYSGYTSEEIRGRSVKDITFADDRPLVEQTLARARLGEVAQSVIRMIHRDGTVVPYRIQASALRGPDGRIIGLVGAGVDISEQLRAEARARDSLRGLESVLDQAIAAVSTIVEKQDPYTAGHQERVTQIALKIAERLGMSEDARHGLRLASLCHDIGKVAVPAEVLTKPSKLTPAETDMIKMHPQVGYDVLSKVQFPWPVAEIVLQHHERLDGSGYPKGLKGDQIMLEARIVGVADVTESMMSHRPYRAAPGLNAALQEIQEGRGRLYDPAVVDACIAVFRQDHFLMAGQNAA
jgi:PAS domain S-box-containing protein/putative nucleotidyltransferase with HDIG domain